MMSKADAMNLSTPRDARFLAEINRQLPPDIDWKAGAVRYAKAVIRDQGECGRLYLFNKPFCTGPDFSSFVGDLSNFVAVVQALRLPSRSCILDVGSGPGWASEYFARLGHSVLGLDICDDFVEIARQRLAATACQAFPGEKLAAEFLAHDIEKSPVPSDCLFDLAYFESTLHHFFNPVAVLRNVSRTLKQDGVIAIIEGSAPPVGSEGHTKLVNVMRQYETIERPYSREQLIELLEITGFPHYRFYFPLCGLYEPRDAGQLRDLVASGAGWNIVIAARTAAGLVRLCKAGAPSDSQMEFGAGFYGEERDAQGRTFCWSGGQASFRCPAGRRVRLTLGSYPPALEGRKQNVRVYCNGRLRETCVLTTAAPEGEVVLDAAGASAELRFESDTLFYPSWFGLPDARTLSYWVRPG
jgi:SAM-dependent methyltransferase